MFWLSVHSEHNGMLFTISQTLSEFHPLVFVLFVVNDKFDTGNAQGFGEGVKGRAFPLWQHNGLRHWPLTGPCHRTRGRGSASAALITHTTATTPPSLPRRLETTASHWICHFCLFIPASGGIVRLEIKTSDIRDTSRSPWVSEVFLLFIQRSSLRSADCVSGADMSRFSNRLATCAHTLNPGREVGIIRVALSLDTVDFGKMLSVARPHRTFL